MANVRNFGVVTGRLSKDVVGFPNADGSRKFMITVAVPNNYKSTNDKGESVVESEFISLEGFVPADKQDGVYTLMHEGDLVSIEYSVRSNNYVDKQGVAQYGQVLRINTDGIALLETKAVTEARAQKKAAEAAAQAQG